MEKGRFANILDKCRERLNSDFLEMLGTDFVGGGCVQDELFL
jgi:hypothetical protein